MAAPPSTVLLRDLVVARWIDGSLAAWIDPRLDRSAWHVPLASIALLAGRRADAVPRIRRALADRDLRLVFEPLLVVDVPRAAAVLAADARARAWSDPARSRHHARHPGSGMAGTSSGARGRSRSSPRARERRDLRARDREPRGDRGARQRDGHGRVARARVVRAARCASVRARGGGRDQGISSRPAGPACPRRVTRSARSASSIRRRWCGSSASAAPRLTAVEDLVRLHRAVARLRCDRRAARVGGDRRTEPLAVRAIAEAIAALGG